jgi:predicted benzoate:H+ symporter BenE
MPPTKLPPQSVLKVNIAVIKANIDASILAGITFIIITVIGTTLNEVYVPFPNSMIKALTGISPSPNFKLVR